MHRPPLLRAARRLAGLRPEARRFAARAWLAAPLVRGSLALLGLRSTLQWVEAAPGGPRPDAPRIGVSEGSVLVRRAFRAHVVGGECLPQAIVQYLLHVRDGVPARLVVGVRRPERGLLEAHAWVEADDLQPDSTPPFGPIFVARATGNAA